jgi:SAM-dependent methyltransferase
MPIRKESVDVLICSGVLHHTPDPQGGYEELLKLVKPGGKIIIGLYNTYARIPLGIRKVIFSTTGKTFRWMDAHMRRKDVDKHKKEIWFADQYRNPHESWHSVDEVLKWFEKTNVEFLCGVPDIAGKLENEMSDMRLFERHPLGSTAQHIFKQLTWMYRIGGEGGLFVMVGEKKI